MLRNLDDKRLCAFTGSKGQAGEMSDPARALWQLLQSIGG
jgi:hypothetical protein